jgi:hypothetical protein
VEHPTTTHDAPSGMSITKVQQWVLSMLALTVIEHFAAGLAIAGVFADDQDARVGLNVLAGVTGVFGVAAFRALHGKRILSAWLLLGPLPGVVGAWLTFR